MWWTNLTLVQLLLVICYIGSRANGEKGPILAETRSFRSSGITADSPHCARISKNILDRKGTIADAAIAGLVCMGAVHPQSSGIGGGFIAVHYDPKTKRSTVLNAREKAPEQANSRMFDGRENEASVGGKAVAVPGEVKGYAELYKRFGGKVPWQDLFTPTVNLLRNGFQVDEHLYNALRSNQRYIKDDSSLREAFIDPKTGEIWRQGDTVKFATLARTLETIGKQGGEYFYSSNSPLAKSIIDDLRGYNSIITMDDFRKYTAKWQDTVKLNIGNGITMHTSSAPGSGALMAFVFRILQNYRSSLRADHGDSLHLLTEAFKHAYGRRGKLGDPDDPNVSSSIREHEQNLVSSASYLKTALDNIRTDRTSNDARTYQDGYSDIRGNGTAHYSIIGPNGDSLSVTTTVNTYLGARIRSKQTGIIFNDQMADFAKNSNERSAHPANEIAGGKRPLSSACPVIFTDQNGRVVLTTGASGGIKILSAVTFVSLNHLWYGKSLGQAVEMARIHHTLDPMVAQIEDNFDSGLRRELENKGHRMSRAYGKTIVTSVGRGSDGTIYAVSDPRKPSSVDGQ